MYGTTLLAALNSRQSLAAHGSGLSTDTSPFGFSGVSQPPRGANAAGHGPSHRVHASQLRPGLSTSDHDSSDSVIELKATSFGASERISSDALSSATVPVALDEKALPV
ncbi:hypothetical protein PYCCODRAFT_1437193 [Trametes coccinea BRFM310]|uniref:Uncharacterized protein n=1 Tax=Trametes coccinea (strain BRFM310) TaxID=1353009 RepID=A0A1Y2IHI9_TRAC3|nr:hypothetical protein PYCCODRAFT_1437193 [Trametes coccinea BRFM310]